MINLPDSYWEIRYVGARYPGAAAVTARPGLDEGANCQLFAYAVLRHHGLKPPALRSSELWADTVTTQRVTVPKALDLVLFNSTSDAWGAHVGVWAGESKVLHLCASVGRPALWHVDEFAVHPSYRVLIGYKRVLAHVT